VTIDAGIDDLLILRSAGSGFEGYIKDRYTTLPETKDRIFQTALVAIWRYKSRALDFNAQWEQIRATILDTFATHPSRSVQHTLHAIGKQVLAAFPDVSEIQLTMPNKHALLVDLSPFGLDNPPTSHPAISKRNWCAQQPLSTEFSWATSPTRERPPAPALA
jgi:urate oxidase